MFRRLEARFKKEKEKKNAPFELELALISRHWHVNICTTLNSSIYQTLHEGND